MSRLTLVAVVLSLSAAPALAQPVTDLSELEIRALDTVKVTVEVSGDLGPRTVVVSDVPGINCGAFAYRYSQGENRQCWLWASRGHPLTLTARGMKGRAGMDWRVQWQGCEPSPDGSQCSVTPRKQGAQISAVFSGSPQS